MTSPIGWLLFNWMPIGQAVSEQLAVHANGTVRLARSNMPGKSSSMISSWQMEVFFQSVLTFVNTNGPAISVSSGSLLSVL
jgi:hypothetical protein